MISNCKDSLVMTEVDLNPTDESFFICVDEYLLYPAMQMSLMCSVMNSLEVTTTHLFL